MGRISRQPKKGKVELLGSAVHLRQALDGFDFYEVAQTLGVSVNKVKKALLTTAMNRTIVEFTRGILTLKYQEKEEMKQRGKLILAPYKSHRECVGDIIWAQGDHECRILMDTALIPAVVEAQRRQKTSPITIASSTSTRQTDPDERLLIVQDYELPADETGETHGLIEYVILLVPEDSYTIIRVGSNPIASRAGDSLLAIVEFNSPFDWGEARTRLAAQCIALLKNTGRDLFPAVLTSGRVWIFCVAVAHGGGITIYESEAMGWNINDDTDAVIVTALVELMQSPCALPSIFELGNRYP